MNKLDVDFVFFAAAADSADSQPRHHLMLKAELVVQVHALAK